jgi:carboxylesterase
MMNQREPQHPTRNSSLAHPPLGVLLLHGFTSSLATVNGMVPHLEARGIPYALPTLRGHGTRPEELAGVAWHHWYEDAERALDELLDRCERVVVMGLSMGGVAALHLAVQRPERLAGVVTVAPALHLNITGKWLLPLLGRSTRQAKVDVRRAFEDGSLAAQSTNYISAPIAAVYSLVRFGQLVERELPRMRVPLLVLYTPRDRVVLPESARIVYERAGTPPAEKAIRAFERSGHEMLLDQQREEVFAAIMAFVEAHAK